jgi:hypothetical protein
VTAAAVIEPSSSRAKLLHRLPRTRGAPVRKKYYWFALIPLAGFWIYSISQSARELLGMLPAGPARPGVTLQLPNTPLRTPLATRVEEAAAAESMGAPAAELPPAPVPRPAAPPVAEPAPAVYADAEPVTRGAEPLDHPEVTDPHSRKLLRPAWDD